jgi:hypothetical protein
MRIPQIWLSFYIARRILELEASRPWLAAPQLVLEQLTSVRKQARPTGLSVAGHNDRDVWISLLKSSDRARPSCEICLAGIAHRGRRGSADQTSSGEDSCLLKPDGRVVNGMARAGEEQLASDAERVERKR